ncbi:UNVERIFIED_CONTAM: hypothetical protein FKN15_034888 [Acipenser sinensis]
MLMHWGDRTVVDPRASIAAVFLKAVISPDYLLILDYRNLNLERWLFRDLASQIAGDGQLVTYSLPFEFRAIEAILQHRIDTLQTRLQELQPQILETLESLVDPKMLSVDRSKLHVLLQNSKNLSELETDIKVFKESLLEILDEEELIEELCLTKWTDPQVFEESSLGIDQAEEMELLLENYYRQAEDLANTARELKGLIDDSESVIFINLDRLLKKHLDAILDGRKKIRWFFPLCGKAVDMKWLADMGHTIVGVDVSEIAIKEFFTDQNLPYTEEPVPAIPGAKAFKSSDGKISLYNCNLYDFCSSVAGKFDGIWDRGSLVAINPSDRQRYATLIISLMTKDCRYLLDTLLYNPSLYKGKMCNIQMLESVDAQKDRRPGE